MNLYCTADRIGIETGGGKVTGHELLALRSLGDVIAVGGETLESHRPEFNANPFLLDEFAEQKIIDILKSNSIKVAHFYAGTFTKTIKRLKEAGVKVCYTAAAHDKQESINEFQRLGYTYPFQHISDPQLWSQYVEGYRLADIVICPSQRGIDIMKSYGCDNKRIVISHGVELPSILKPLPNRFAVGYLGQAGPDKGIPYLVRAWKKLDYKDANLLIAGNQIDVFLGHARADGGRNIHLMGFVKSTSDLFNACSVYVQPSVTEGFGIEILEAMAHARPVIASEGAGASELVEDGVTGFVIPIRDVDGIAEAIEWCRVHPKEAAEMGIRGKQKVEAFTWDKIRAEYIKIWESLG